MSSLPFTPVHPLKQFASWYILEKLPRVRPQTQTDRSYRVERVCRDFTAWLDRAPTIADLDRELISTFLKSREGKPCFVVYRDLLRTLRRLAIELNLLPKPYVGSLLDSIDRRGKEQGRQRRALSNLLSAAEKTLWQTCLTRYFPTNLAIRSPKTQVRYKAALLDFRDFLGHDPTAEDLSDDNVLGMMVMLRDVRKLQPPTVNERAARIRALWEWMARKRLVHEFPSFGRIAVPKRLPRAWSREQLDQLFRACAQQPGTIAGVPAADWWTALHHVLWDCGERIGAVMQLEWRHFDVAQGLLDVPAELRRGNVQDMSYRLHAETVATLVRIQQPPRDRVFTWDRDYNYLWARYGEILKRAGLPNDRTSKFHRMRRSMASHLAAAGHNATVALAHSSEAVTRQSYLDPHVVQPIAPADVLFRPRADWSAEKMSRPDPNVPWANR